MLSPTVKDKRSAIGPAYKTPIIPKKCGSITTSGSRNRICLVRERKVPLYAFPIELTKVQEIGCKKFNQVKNRKILK